MRPRLRIVSLETRHYFQWAVVVVHTDSTVTGIGQAAYWGWPPSLAPIVDSLASLLRGEDPLRVEHLSERVRRWRPSTSDAVSAAISAIDIALWDVAGKALGQPIHQLMGGRHRERLRLHLLIDEDTTEALVAKAKAAKERGYTALKFDAFPSGEPESSTFTHAARMVVERVTAVREAVGWDMDLILHFHREPGPGEAVALARAVAPFRLYFIEDPIPPPSADSLGVVSAQIATPIATGVRSYSIYEFRELLVKNAVQFVRPDIGLAGGITHCRKIAAVAEAFHAQVSAHNFFSPLLTAATAQLYAAIPNAATLEYLEWEEEAPRIDQLINPLQREGGYLMVPTEPGLGVTLNEKMIDQYPYETWDVARVRVGMDASVYAR